MSVSLRHFFYKPSDQNNSIKGLPNEIYKDLLGNYKYVLSLTQIVIFITELKRSDGLLYNFCVQHLKSRATLHFT